MVTVPHVVIPVKTAFDAARYAVGQTNEIKGTGVWSGVVNVKRPSVRLTSCSLVLELTGCSRRRRRSRLLAESRRRPLRRSKAFSRQVALTTKLIVAHINPVP